MFLNRAARKYVQDNGGMVSLYQEIVDHFVNKGFKIYEVKKDNMYLHFGNMRGKAGIQIHQIEKQAARISYGAETPFGLSTEHQLMVKSKGNYKEVILKIESAVDEFGAITPLHEQYG